MPEYRSSNGYGEQEKKILVALDTYVEWSYIEDMSKDGNKAEVAKEEKAMETIIPAENFQVKKIEGLKFPVPGGYHLISGWGLFDLSLNAWVSMEKDGAPTAWKLKRQAALSAAGGLIEGRYRTYCPSGDN